MTYKVQQRERGKMEQAELCKKVVIIKLCDTKKKITSSISKCLTLYFFDINFDHSSYLKYF
jgi:hypothetical protein